jgi:hypothetical protein
VTAIPAVRGAPGVRRALMRRFPYTVVFLVDGDSILVRGQAGTVVEQLDDGVFEVDFCDDEGRTYAQVSVPARALLRLHHHRT